MIPRNEAQRISSNLKELGASLPCPRCGHGEFGIAGYFNLTDFDQPETIKIKMASNPISLIAVICKNCGYFGFHALNAINREKLEEP